jgi:hypothetical protein
MIVNYKRAGVWLIQYGKMVDAPKDMEGKSIQEQVFQGGNVKILPGLNTLTDKQWSQIKDHPKVAAAVESGLLEIIEGPAAKGQKPKDEIESLAKYDQNTAISAVGGQMDASVLASWRKGEKRPMVLKAIKDQLEAVKKADEAFNQGA